MTVLSLDVLGCRRSLCATVRRGAYGTFGVGVSLRAGKEGTSWCGPCWRALLESEAVP